MSDSGEPAAVASSPGRTGSVLLEEHVLLPGAAFDPREPGILYSLHDSEDARLEEMQKHGVSRMVLSIRAPGVQGVTAPGDAVKAAAEANDYLAGLVERHPSAYSAFAALPFQDIPSAVNELVRAVRELGCVGVMVNGYTDDGEGSGLYCDDPRFLPFWEAVDDLAVPVYLHPRRPYLPKRGGHGGYPELEDAPSTWSFGVETGVHALRIMLSGLFDRFPRLRLVLGHMGELLPYAAWRFDNRSRLECPSRLERTISEYLAENCYITTSGVFDDDVLRLVLAKVGAQRVLFSVDYPFESLEEADRWITTTPVLDADARERVMRGNALELFSPASASWS